MLYPRWVLCRYTGAGRSTSVITQSLSVMLGAGERRGQQNTEARIQLQGSTEAVRMKPSHGDTSSGCYQRSGPGTPPTTPLSNWHQRSNARDSLGFHSPARTGGDYCANTPPRSSQDTPRKDTPTHSSPARISYRAKDELWCNEPEIPPLRKEPTSSTFARNRMDELLGILRLDVVSCDSLFFISDLYIFLSASICVPNRF